MSIELAKQFHAAHVEPLIGTPVGASEAEVRKLERELQLRLPQSYRDYLLWMGKDQNGILRGSDWFIYSVSSNKEVLVDMLEEDGIEYSVKQSHVVFFSHQGYMPAWFDADSASEDPPCWILNGDPTAVRPTGNFSTALLDEIRRGYEGLKLIRDNPRLAASLGFR